MYDPRVEFTLPCILYSIEAILNLQSCLACLFALIVWLVIVSCPERLSSFFAKNGLHTVQTQLQKQRAIVHVSNTIAATVKHISNYVEVCTQTRARKGFIGPVKTGSYSRLNRNFLVGPLRLAHGRARGGRTPGCALKHNFRRYHANGDAASKTPYSSA